MINAVHEEKADKVSFRAKSMSFCCSLLNFLSGTAVILTRHSSKAKYEALLSGLEAIESSLHGNLIEHLNAEVVLQTITNGEVQSFFNLV